MNAPCRAPSCPLFALCRPSVSLTQARRRHNSQRHDFRESFSDFGAV
jgi:hypothetical protein